MEHGGARHQLGSGSRREGREPELHRGASGSFSTIRKRSQLSALKGGVLFVAAGNTGAIDNTAPTSLITVVSATQETDLLASFSTYRSFVDFGARQHPLPTTKGGGYQYWWGPRSPRPSPQRRRWSSLGGPISRPRKSTRRSSRARQIWAPQAPISIFGAGQVNAAAAVQLAGGSGPPCRHDTADSLHRVADQRNGVGHRLDRRERI